jgi:RNA recognition motif-containing protein
MPEKLYIGNVQYDATEYDLRKLFKNYEPIHSIILISDKNNSKPRGFGFVELEEPKAELAVHELNRTIYMGRSLVLSKATGRDPRDTKEEGCEGQCPAPQNTVEPALPAGRRARRCKCRADAGYASVLASLEASLSANASVL